MSEMVAFRQGTSMPSRETILHYVVETVSQITELEPALHLLPWSGVNSAIYEQRFAQCYDEGLCAAQTSAPNIPQGILPSTDWAQGIGLLCFAAVYERRRAAINTQSVMRFRQTGGCWFIAD